MTARYRPAEGAVSAEVDGITIVLAPTMEFVRLDDTGAEVWRALDAHDTVDGVVDVLAEVYDAPREVLTADVTAYLDDLVESGLVARVDAR